MTRARDLAKLNPASSLSLQGLVGVNGTFPCFTQDDVLRAAEISGIVTQSSGVPTGAIVEEGSNANGQYTRWADGTQICSFLQDTSVVTSFAVGNIFLYNALNTLTFPAPFIAPPNTGNASRFTHPVNGSAGTTRGWGHISSATTTATSMLSWGYAATGAMYLGYVAVGRWF